MTHNVGDDAQFLSAQLELLPPVASPRRGVCYRATPRIRASRLYVIPKARVDVGPREEIIVSELLS